MARDLYISQGLSASTINSLAQATRNYCDISDNENFDIIRFLEVDILRLIPEFYLFIEDDNAMNGSKAFVTEDSNGIVVAESVYNDAVGGLFYARKILAHEFGHVLLHYNKGFETKHSTFEGYEKQIKNTEVFHSAEWQAETFAIMLLISPILIDATTKEDDFRKRFGTSPKLSSYVLNRLKSFRKREKTPDMKAVHRILSGRVSQRPITEGAQFSLFFDYS